MEIQEAQDNQEVMDNQANYLMDQLLKDLQDHLDQTDNLANPDKLEMMDNQEMLDLQDHPDQTEDQEIQDNLEVMDNQEVLENKDQRYYF